MIILCDECGNRFDAETMPEKCPICGKEPAFGFSVITIRDRNGRILTYREYIEKVRAYYLAHPPEGITKKEINAMSESQLEDMDDIISELMR